ncbi:MAG: biopolymer transporter ExbD [bacterium]
MAFKRFYRDHRKIQMLSLIDLIFILLLFFIITSVMIKLTRGETKLFVPTPKNEPGEAQILIQIMDEDDYFWLDHTAVDTLNRYSYQLFNPDDPKAKMDLLLTKMKLNSDLLNSRLEDLKKILSKDRNKEYFVLIRCPENKPYYYAINIIEQLVGLPNLEYGCVSGTIEDIRQSRDIIINSNLIQINL